MNETADQLTPPDSPAAPVDPTNNPRALVTGSGFVLQVFGAILLFGSLTVWALSAFSTSATSTPTPRWIDHLTGPTAATALVTLALFISLIGGLGLMAAGVGMQGEKKGSAKVGAAFGLVMAIGYGVIAALLLFSAQRLVLGIGLLLLGLLSLGAALLALIRHATLKQFPPPADYNLLTEEIIEEIRRKRDQRRKEYDL